MNLVGYDVTRKRKFDDYMGLLDRDYYVMNEGAKKEETLGQLKQESPRLLDWCLDDWMCGRYGTAKFI